MFTLPRMLAAMGLAVALGLGSTDYFLRVPSPVGTTSHQMWTGWPSIGLGTQENVNNPYLQAHIGRNGYLPLGVDEGIVLRSSTDAVGDVLKRNCDYLVSGDIPSAVLWTLTVSDAAGNALPNPSQRYGISSDSLLYEPDGSFKIVISRDVQPNNWVSLGDFPIDSEVSLSTPIDEVGTTLDTFAIAIRLYGASIASDTSATTVSFPVVTRGKCV